MVNTSHQKSYQSTKIKKSFNLKKYLLSYDKTSENQMESEDEAETVIEYLEKWNKASIGSKYQNLPAAKKKYIIRDIIFQRLAVALSLISVDDLQVCVDEYTELKEEQNITLYDFLIQKNVLTEEVIDRLLNFQNPFDNSPLIPGYKIIESIGEGGMGAVFLGQKITTQEKYAIKIFAPPVSDVSTEIARFKRECKVAMKLDSPYIIKSYDSGDFYGMYYLVMEYIDGEPLDKKLEKRKRLYTEEALEIFEKLLIGMSEAWNRNFVHRDIKPSNILVKEDGTVKICDLGLAKAIDCDEKLTETGSVFGTPQYIAPERFMGDEIDYRIDVYALGITLYEMLTGYVPFSGSTYVEICQKHLYDEPASPDFFGVRVPKNITYFLLQLLSKKPSDRCKNPTELLENFHLVQQGKKPKGSVSYYREKRRKKVEKGLIVANVIVLSACITIYFYKEYKRNQEERMLIEEEQNKTAQEKEKILAEKQILAEEHHKIQTELEQQEILNKKQELVKSIKLLIANLHFEKSNEKIQEMKVTFPSASETQLMQSLLDKVIQIQKSVANSDPVSLIYLESLTSFLEPSITTKMMQKMLETASVDKKGFVLNIWLQAPESIHENILQALIRENDIDWLRHTFIEMSGRNAEIFYPVYLKLDLKDAQQLKKIRDTWSCLIQTDKNVLEEILNNTEDDQFVIKVFHYASLEQKKKVVDNLDTLLQSLSENNIHAIAKQLYTNVDAKITLLFLKKIRQNNNKVIAKILFEVMQYSQHSAIRKIALQLLVKHKHASHLQQNVVTLSEDKQLDILKNLENDNGHNTKVLLAIASSSFSTVREQVIKKIALWNNESMIPCIQKMLMEDEYYSVRKEAAETLGKISSPKALAALVEAIEFTDDFVTGKTILENISLKKNEVAATAIIQIILDRPEYRRYAYEQLPVFPSEITIPIITDAIDHVGPTEARLMIYSLEKIGLESAQSLIQILEETEQFYLQKATIKALGSIGSIESIPIVLKMYSNRRTKRYALSSLEKIIKLLSDDDPQKIKVVEIIY